MQPSVRCADLIKASDETTVLGLGRGAHEHRLALGASPAESSADCRENVAARASSFHRDLQAMPAPALNLSTRIIGPDDAQWLSAQPASERLVRTVRAFAPPETTNVLRGPITPEQQRQLDQWQREEQQRQDSKARPARLTLRTSWVLRIGVLAPRRHDASVDLRRVRTGPRRWFCCDRHQQQQRVWCIAVSRRATSAPPSRAFRSSTRIEVRRSPRAAAALRAG